MSSKYFPPYSLTGNTSRPTVFPAQNNYRQVVKTVRNIIQTARLNICRRWNFKHK